MSLGRGLEALITSTSSKKQSVAQDDGGSGKVWLVPLSKIEPSKGQPRRIFNEDNLKELAASIKKYNILQPLLVTEKSDGGYELVVGERRLRAAKLAGLSLVPVMVKNLANRERLEVALIENIQRENLSPLEEAWAYKRLVDEFNLTQQEVAEKVGKSRPAVANTIRLLDLSQEAQEALSVGKINAGQARALLSLNNPKDQLEMLSSMLGEKITVRELERKVGQRRTDKTALRRDPNLAYLEDKLRLALGTKVAISQKGERGNITISYFSKEELARIIKKISE